MSEEKALEIIEAWEAEHCLNECQAKAKLQCLIAEGFSTLQAELEAVKAENERLKAESEHSCHDNCQRIACVQRREIERLREALKMIQTGDCNYPEQVARKALTTDSGAG